MKVERNTKKKFEPIVITLETEKDAEALWHLLDVPNGQSLLDYQDGLEGKSYEVTQFGYDLFCALDDFYTPEGYEG